MSRWALVIAAILPRIVQRAVFYFTPTLVDRISENPFKAAERHYPVEMPYAKDAELYFDDGYSERVSSGGIAEIGRGFDWVTAAVILNMFCRQDGDQIHFRTRIRLVKANYEPQDYASLRDFLCEYCQKGK